MRASSTSELENHKKLKTLKDHQQRLKIEVKVAGLAYRQKCKAQRAASPRGRAHVLTSGMTTGQQIR
jgi:hypothetical protein